MHMQVPNYKISEKKMTTLKKETNNETVVLEVKDLNAWFGSNHVVHNISLNINEHQIISLIGPSGCGKSTFLRCINRLHEEVLGAKVKGQISLKGMDIYGPRVDPVEIRRHIGMVFQKPNPFPALSIFENVVIGLKLSGIRKKSVLMEVAEKALMQAVLWDEVKDKLHQPGTSLSGGQQQRLCIARALAVSPPVILMDEPTSALDPISTAKIEELIVDLKKETTVVIVTHNMQQASRISDHTAFFLLGKLIEYSETRKMFTNPEHAQTESYITGRFG